ncbi:MAG: helix-turn-helix domain-containing protein [Verrucomicrobiota bacterium]
MSTTQSEKDLTPAEIAREMQINEQVVRRYLREEYIKGYKCGGAWRVTREALDHFKSEGGTLAA